jgi:uncharacterized protein YegL
MSDIRGQLLPIYVVVDESTSMGPYMHELNAGLTSLHEALMAEPMAAAKVRFSVIGFSNTAIRHMHLQDLRRVDVMPPLRPRGATNYGAAFSALLQQIPYDVHQLKAQRYAIHRPAVFFLSDGQPTDGNWWYPFHQRLTNRQAMPEAPNIIACGIGQAEPRTILAVATEKRFAFVSLPGTDVGRAIAKFCTALTKSIIASGRSMAAGNAELIVDPPQEFRLAIDVI